MWQTALIGALSDKRTWIISGIIAFLIIFYFWARKDSDRRKDDQAEKQIEDEAKELGLDPRDIRLDARGMVNALGVDKAWYDPTGWTENEKTAVRILENYSRASYPVLADAYYEIASRSLTSDLYTYLEEWELEPVVHIIS